MAEQNSDRICKQSGVIPYRTKNGGREILLITSLGSGKWIIPKGIIEAGMSSKKSAMKEAFEEAGIIGEIQEPAIGSYSYPKWGMMCQVEVFPCEVSALADKWPEKSDRKRQWFPQNKAVEKIKINTLKELINKFIEEYQSA